MTSNLGPVNLLIIDDQLSIDHMHPIDREGRYGVILDEISSNITKPSSQHDSSDIRVFASKDVKYPKKDLWTCDIVIEENTGLSRKVWKRISKMREDYKNDEDILGDVPSLDKIDIILLDLNGVKESSVDWKIDPETLENICDQFGDECENRNFENDASILNKYYEGASWYLTNMYRDHLSEVDSIFIVTTFHDRTDREGLYGSDKEVYDNLQYLNKYIDPFIKNNHIEGFPTTAKYSAGDLWGKKHVAAYINYYCNLREHSIHLSSRERNSLHWAAYTDYPSIIVGEPHTGRERIAKVLGRSWMRLKHLAALQEERGSLSFPNTATIKDIDCRYVSEDQAFKQLFGGVSNNKLQDSALTVGAFLDASGLNFSQTFTPSDSIGPADEFKSLINNATLPTESDGNSEKNIFHRKNTDAILGNSGYDYEVGGYEDWGVVYLHEFHHLPHEVHTALVRYLREGVIQPRGYPGLIHLPNVKIIVSSSHPKVAAALGINDVQNRSSANHDFPVQEDLLLELKWHTFRSMPVTGSNAEDIFQSIARNQYSTDFSEEAVTYVGDEIMKIYRLMNGDSEEEMTDDDERERTINPVFGHHRELKRLIELTKKYISTASKRGKKISSQSEALMTVWETTTVSGYKGAPKPDDPMDICPRLKSKSMKAWYMLKPIANFEEGAKLKYSTYRKRVKGLYKDDSHEDSLSNIPARQDRVNNFASYVSRYIGEVSDLGDRDNPPFRVCCKKLDEEEKIDDREDGSEKTDASEDENGNTDDSEERYVWWEYNRPWR